MKAAFLFALFSGCLCLMTHASVSNFKDMVYKVVEKKYSSYTGYGCHCFLGGRGRPMDGTDWCCLSHNCCYLRLEQRGCKPRRENYTFKASGRSVTCAGSSEDCEPQACECDKRAALCLLNNKSSYTVRYKNKRNLTCKGNKPAC